MVKQQNNESNMNIPTWLVPTQDAAVVEASRLGISEILDRQMACEKILTKADPDSNEAKQARVMLKATYIALNKRYVK